MHKAPQTIQDNYLNALAGEKFDFAVSAIKFLIGNSLVHIINNYIGREIFLEIRPQMDESIKWIINMDGFTLGKDGDYYYERTSSSRTEAYIKMTRFDSKEEALNALLKYENKYKGSDRPLYMKEIEE
jgi:hypothetical protein